MSLKQVSREITAWSVQTERVFVLQFSNSEHPSLDIPMPSNETGHSGTVIILPTVTGEYTEEGMVYTPVAWNIGAFGDSYTLNNDVTAILQLSSRVALPTVYSYSGTQTESSVAPDASIDTGLTYDSGNLYLGETNDGQGNATRYGWEAEEGPEYEEILMYLPGGETNKYYYQGGVTSSYSNNPGSSYLKTLYSDSELSIPATFDSTKRYEYGWYNNDGVWVVSSVQSVSDMPVSTVSSNGTIACIIYNDSGMAKLWFVSNYTSSSAYTAYSSSPVRIRARLYSL